MNKKARDNRSKQMNPNNVLYYKSRMGNVKKHKPRSRGNLGFACKLCGRAGKLTCEYNSFDKGMRCGYCDGWYRVNN